MTALLALLCAIIAAIAALSVADVYTCRTMTRPERSEVLTVPMGDPAPRCPRGWLIEWDGPALTA